MGLADELKQVQPSIVEEVATHRAKLDAKITKAKYKVALDEIRRLEQETSVLKAISFAPRPIVPAKPKAMSKGARATAVLLLSDWHVEEEVLPAHVNGLNAYNLEVAERSVKEVFERFLALLENERGMATIENLIVWVGGDLISGHIHQELQENCLLSPCEATLFAEDLLEWGLRYLAKHSGAKSIGVVTSVGNHGRTTIKMPYAGAHRHSFEWLAYKHTAARLRDEKRIGWDIGESYLAWATVEGGHELRFHHGDAIRYRDGIGGLTIPVNKAEGEWNKTRRSTWTGFGHLHQWTPNKRWLCNGSVIGYSPFAMKNKFGHEDPCQSMAIVDSKRGVTSVKQVFCR